ncbi:response regulator [Pacificimonas sp. ICDLI1SI03]
MEASAAVILIVEDEPLIRFDVSEQLEAQGFRVLEAGTGGQALATIERVKRVDIVFTDVDMPGKVNGLLLARQVRARWPAIGIIVTSGQAVISPDDLPARCRFYPKPYRMEKISGAMQELLS